MIFDDFKNRRPPHRSACQRTRYLTKSPKRRPAAEKRRLILERLLREAARSFHLTDERIATAHTILIRWADLETSGRLEQFGESQMQGQVLAEIFGQALGYIQFSENATTYNQIQHHEIAGETPDAVLGQFRQGEPIAPLAVVELKRPEMHLDRDRSSGRTAIQQCWDYLDNTSPECRWGIVSNVISFRL